MSPDSGVRGYSMESPCLEPTGGNGVETEGRGACFLRFKPLNGDCLYSIFPQHPVKVRGASNSAQAPFKG
jgi:hypothetical protein